MTKFHVTWLYESGAIAMTDTLKASNCVDAQKKAQRIANDFSVQDSLKRKVVVGTITRLQA